MERITREEAINRNIKKIKRNLSVIENPYGLKSEYPYLYRIIRGINRYLCDFNLYAKDKVINFLCRYQGNYYFFVSARHIARIHRYAKYNTWNRNLNLFATLGMINKVPTIELTRTLQRRTERHRKKLFQGIGIPDDEIKEITFYIIPEYNYETLQKANEVAKKLYDCGYRANAFTKQFLIRYFGQQFANKIFRDERKISQFNEYLAKEIEDFILDEININGYTTKDNILKNFRLNRKEIDKFDYDFSRENSKAIILREYERCKVMIFKKHNLKRGRATKKLMNKFGLKSYISIICREEDWE